MEELVEKELPFEFAASKMGGEGGGSTEELGEKVAR